MRRPSLDVRRELEDDRERRRARRCSSTVVMRRSVGMGPSVVRVASCSLRVGDQRAVRRKPSRRCTTRCHARRRAARCVPARRRKSAQHRDDTIVARDAVKAQGKRDEPESGRRDPTSSEIANDHRTPRDAIQLAHESLRRRRSRNDASSCEHSTTSTLRSRKGSASALAQTA